MEPGGPLEQTTSVAPRTIVAAWLVPLAALALAGCSAPASHRTTTGESAPTEGCVPGAGPPETALRCDDCAAFLDESRRGEAICPCHAPLDGAPCCRGSAAWCGATMSACRYDRCGAAGELVEARCLQGRWRLRRTACEPCPRSDCGRGQVCVTWRSREGSRTECRPDPCGRRPLSCDCAAAACAGAGGGSCAPDLLGGDHVICLIPHSGPAGGLPRR